MKNLLIGFLLLSKISIYAQCVVIAPVPDDACYQQTIANDSYCCNTAWDGICQDAYDACSGNSTNSAIIAPVPVDFCYEQVITDLPSCCETEWDSTCQATYNTCMGIPNCPVVAPVPTDFCYQQVVSNIPECCSVAWDSTCQLAYDFCTGDEFCNAWPGVTQNACYFNVIEEMPQCCDSSWGSECTQAYYDCMGIESGCNSDVSICTPGVSQPFSFNQNTPGPPTDYADPVGCSTGSFGNDFGFGFIILYITQSGPLNLLIDGSATSGYIDVIVYNIPDGVAPCQAVMDQNNEIGCNYATDAVGCTQFGTDFPCTSSVDAPIVNAGQRIMVIVHDYSSQSTTFTLELSGQGAQTGPPDATIAPVSGPLCNNDAAIQLSSNSLGGNWTGNGVSLSGLFDPALAGPGIHTITYSIGTSPCNDADQVTIEVLDCTSMPCNVSASGSTPVCLGDSLTLNASNVLNGSYTWSGPNFLSDLQNPPAFYPGAQPGIYQYKVEVIQDSVSCSDSIQIEIKDLPYMSFNFQVEQLDTNEIQVQFFNQTSGAVSYEWDFDYFSSVSYEENPVFNYLLSTQNQFTIWLTGTSEFGCVDSTSQLLRYIRPFEIATNSYFIPNSFTPNGDELNNTFRPIFTAEENIISYHLLVYDKWGELIFESKDVQVGWDGTYNEFIVQNGTYNWFIEFQEKESPTEKKQIRGFVNLIK